MSKQRSRMTCYCSVAESECLNPPAYAVGGRVGTNPEPPKVTARCAYCGDFVCAACRVGKRGVWVCKTHRRDDVEYLGIELPPPVKLAVTFGVQYNRADCAHPVDKRITGQHYMVFEGEDYRDARRQIAEALGSAWAFDYYWDEFQEQIERYGYVEFKLGTPVELP